ncbi:MULTISPECIES: SDR family NAD(P)-dependent oxidoreductase [unclassified Paenibacillus]|uniref:SDR family oxidoreductase n=1 Tax=unclassified Paenibacillus TaxID=185978 RepID=UPI002404A6E9|nr:MULTISPECIES: SDR family NAD(P)-dependent oxidoreductase [unclassified Paenibacillus]MDF9842926.1 NAD(P)-dependent dehydrogenase (short-subunit alcohol dehydrogenase family) [Paenibacillus sp. PastF-2]MDF9849514.1 NAD(P)-dependent dehydrogenase (short-subunit alcohol dehydrogenase family) [Paenibacillus sp. PastM-2]MDF9856111.1 NAD(P)-dependent dehydrogenase (short-subunit alcohol dehydrogenase family) [Paenibacillus sp. PastF-1]MDH6481357.1 NAD(P)-dependent dehydrogenase (short-subunit alco
MAELKLAGKVAVVTGGGSGIGKASVLEFARNGAKVILLDRTPDNAEKVKRQVEEAGGEALVIECDIEQPQQVKEAIDQAAATWGRLDIVFANAGINGAMAPIETMEMEDWNQTIHINLRGTFATVKYAIPHLKEKGGSILINSSINGNRVFSNIGFSAYSTTKAGQVAFMKMAALELAQYKIRVNAICPGAISTNIDDNTYPSEDLEEVKIPVDFPEGDQPLEEGPGRPDQVAKLALFLASNDSDHITGTEIYCDGAESLLHG